MALDNQLASRLFYAEGILILVLNSLTLLVFLINKRFRKRCFYLVISLTIADFLVGVTLMVYGAVYGSLESGPFHIQKYRTAPLMVLDNTPCGASFAGLIFISMERMHCTVWPLRHRCLENRVYIIVIAAQWLIVGPPMFLAFLFLDLRYYRLAGSVYNIGGLLVIAVAYTKTYLKVRQQNKQHQQAHSPRQKRERELAKTLFIVTAISLMTWLPLAVFSTVNSDSMVFFLVQLLSRFANSLMNPIVYVLRMREFRLALYMLVFKCSRINVNQVAPP